MAFWYAFNRFFQWTDEEEHRNMVTHAKFLWDALYDSETYSNFQEMLSLRGLYDVKYRSLYEKLYWDYVNREKHLHQHQVQEFQTAFQKQIYNKEI